MGCSVLNWSRELHNKKVTPDRNDGKITVKIPNGYITFSTEEEKQDWLKRYLNKQIVENKPLKFNRYKKRNK
jgi:hypothetical protein